MVRLSPSASVASTEQVRVSTLLAELGLMVTLFTTGSLLMTTVDALPESLAPSESVVVTLQVMLSDTLAVAVVRTSESLFPSVAPVVLLVHTTVVLGLSSGSVMV